MQTKFIEGTNKKYSIREDGIVIKHNKKTDKEIIKKNIVTRIMIGNKRLSFSTEKVLMLYFNKFKCKYCNIIFEAIRKKNYTYIKVCNNCIKSNRKKYENRQYVQEKIKMQNKNNIKDISKSYSMSAMNLTMKEFNEELYQLHKINLKLKRELWQKKNLTIKI